jgi:hypothetical protein
MYVLDANLFIQSNRAHYGLDFVPGYWDWLDFKSAAGIICSIEKVGDEIEVGTDELTTWAAARKPMFLKMDGTESPSLTALAAWASSPGVNYTPAAVAEFLTSGDYQLVAYAHAHGHTVVTYERPAPTAKARVKIPDACDAMMVPWTDPYTMLRNESARFVLP